MELDLRSLTATSVLGRGAKGVVFLVRSQSETLALKAISRPPPAEEKVKGDPYRRIRFERDVLRSLRHPLLPSLRGHLSTDAIVAFAMDACPGGDLARLRRAQSEQMFSDDAIRFYAAELVLALDHLHRLRIVYRDLKPENVLIQESGHIMLVDFDLAVKLPPNDSDSCHSSSSPPPPPPTTTDIQRRKRNRNRRRFLNCFSSSAAGISPEITVEASSAAAGTTGSATSQKSNSFVGTEDYVAPEIIKGVGHDFSADWWSLGVVLYEMLYGRTPFRGADRKETFYRILAKVPELVGEKTALRDLIGKLLEKDPEKRIGAEDIRNHDFFRGVVWEEVVEISRPPFIPVGAHWEENCGEGEEEIDVEKFVGQVFGSSGKEGLVSNSNKKDSFGVF